MPRRNLVAIRHEKGRIPSSGAGLGTILVAPEVVKGVNVPVPTEQLPVVANVHPDDTPLFLVELIARLENDKPVFKSVKFVDKVTLSVVWLFPQK